MLVWKMMIFFFQLGDFLDSTLIFRGFLRNKIWWHLSIQSGPTAQWYPTHVLFGWFWGGKCDHDMHDYSSSDLWSKLASSIPQGWRITRGNPIKWWEMMGVDSILKKLIDGSDQGWFFAPICMDIEYWTNFVRRKKSILWTTHAVRNAWNRPNNDLHKFQLPNLHVDP